MSRTLLAALAVLFLGTWAPAQQDEDEGFEGKTVKAIEFIGATVSPESVRSRMKTKIGSPLRLSELNDDIKALAQELRLFSSVTQRLLPFDGGVKVQFFVSENPRIGDLLFLGNTEIEREELEAVIDSRAGGLADDIALKLDEQRIREKYLEDGYHFIQVTHRKIVEDFTTVIFDITEGPKVCVEEVKFVGNKSFDKDDLLEAMPTTDESGFLSGHNYVERDFQSDLVNLSQFYRGKGFLDAKVALQDRTFSLDKEYVFLTIKIEEGTPYTVKSFKLEGVTRFDPKEIEAELKTKVGERYEPFFKIGEDRRYIIRKYNGEGYIDANPVDDSELPETGYEVDVVIRVIEGERARIGDVKIKGNVETKDKVLRRLLEDLVPGAPLNLNTLRRAESRLVSLRYFDPSTLSVIKPAIDVRDFEDYKNVFLTVEDTDRENVKDIEVTVEEVDTGSIRFAVGVNSNAGLVGAIVYRKENFDPTDFPESFDDILDAFTGGGQTLELAFYPGIVETQFQVSYTHPFIFDTDFGLNALFYRRLRVFESYDETRTGFQLAVSKQFGFNISASLRYRLELINIDDIDNDAGQIVFDFEGENLLSSIIFGIRIADLDSFLAPGEGYRLNMVYEFAGLGGDISFNKVDVRAEYYQTIHTDSEERRHILFFKGRFGWAGEVGDTRDVPIYERFFAGGQNSIRGFEFRGVGPMSNNNPDGGEVLILGSLNYSFPLYERLLGGVLFLDSGTLAEDFDSDEVTDFRVAVGFGIRLQIDFLGPVPFAIDFGFPLVEFEGDNTQLISFSLDRQF